MALMLWLDDERNPLKRGLEGWVWVKTVEEAIAVVSSSADEWTDASLDHDLGACDDCLRKAESDQQARECRHVLNGYAFVRWMIEAGRWPANLPAVHSANPVGAQRMREDIARFHPRSDGFYG
jgi:hypothetical protein